jgi:hypothetical protein
VSDRGRRRWRYPVRFCATIPCMANRVETESGHGDHGDLRSAGFDSDDRAAAQAAAAADGTLVRGPDGHYNGSITSE